MKISMLINGRFLLQPITGVQRYGYEFVHALDDWLADHPEYQVSLLMPRRLWFHRPLPSYRHIKIRQVGFLQGPPWEQFEMPFYLRDETVLCLANTAPILSLIRQKNITVTVHSLAYRYFPQSYSLIFKSLYFITIPVVMRYARTLITVSRWEREQILRIYPFVHHKLFAVANGGFADDIKAQVSSKVARASNRVLYVGSLSALKNFPRLVRAMRQVIAQKNSEWVVIGGASGGVVADIPDVLQNNIQWCGQINDPLLIAEHYQKATLLVFPSLYEASPLPVIEAMSLGCPVVCSNIPALIERCGTAAQYCNPQDSDSIATAILQVLEDSSLQENLRQQGYQNAARLTWRNCVAESLRYLFEGKPTFNQNSHHKVQ